MTNDERNPKSECQKVRLGLVLISDFDHWLFFRHWSLVMGHFSRKVPPESIRGELYNG